MKKSRILLLLASLLWILWALLLIAAVLGLYGRGAAARALDPLAPIYSREVLGGILRPLAPLFLAAAGVSAAAGLRGERDETAPWPLGKVDNRPDRGRALRGVLLAAAVLLIAAGLCNGSARDVFGKAIKICTECVGLG